MACVSRTKMKGKIPTMKVIRKEIESAASAESCPLIKDTKTDSIMKSALTRRA